MPTSWHQSIFNITCHSLKSISLCCGEDSVGKNLTVQTWRPEFWSLPCCPTLLSVLWQKTKQSHPGEDRMYSSLQVTAHHLMRPKQEPGGRNGRSRDKDGCWLLTFSSLLPQLAFLYNLGLLAQGWHFHGLNPLTPVTKQENVPQICPWALPVVAVHRLRYSSTWQL